MFGVAFSFEGAEETDYRLFYVDAPGGSGKRLLFNMIKDYLNANNITTVISAGIGINATLSRCGKTLRQVNILIIDEASMVPCHALEAIDNCLTDTMNPNTEFGGNIVLLGAADFRQVFPPFVPRAPAASVPDACFKRSDI